MHAVVAAAGIAVAFDCRESGFATALVLAAICHASWTAGRGVGLGLALIAGSLELVGHGPQTPRAVIAIAGLWAMVYVAVALGSSLIERKTRPED
jgi:hypothetical protein